MLLLVLLAAAPVTSVAPLTPLERSLAAHARDGKLEGTTLLDAAHLMAALRDEPVLGEKVSAALGGCAGHRAHKAAVAGDWPLALAEVRRGLHDAPKDEGLRQNLAIALHNHAASLLSAGRCDEVRALLPELDAKDARLMNAVRQACP